MTPSEEVRMIDMEKRLSEQEAKTQFKLTDVEGLVKLMKANGVNCICFGTLKIEMTSEVK